MPDDRIRILRKMYSLRKITRKHVIGELGEDYKIIGELEKKLRVKPEVSLYALKIRRLQVNLPNYIINPKKVCTRPDCEETLDVLQNVRSISTCLPVETMLVLEFPLEKADEVNLDGLGYEHYCIIESVGARPSTRGLELLFQGDYMALLDPDRVRDIIDEADIDVFVESGRHPDWVDLEIIRITTKNPWISTRRLAQILEGFMKTGKFKVRSAESHVRHVEKFLRGYRVARLVDVWDQSPFYIIVYGECENVTRAVRMSVTHPLVVGTTVLGESCSPDNPRPYGIAVQSYVPEAAYTSALATTAEIVRASGCKPFAVKTISKDSTLVFTIGSRATGEYDPKEGFRFPGVDLIVETLEERGYIVRVISGARRF